MGIAVGWGRIPVYVARNINLNLKKRWHHRNCHAPAPLPVLVEQLTSTHMSGKILLMNLGDGAFAYPPTQSTPDTDMPGSRTGFCETLQLVTRLVSKLGIPHCVIGAAAGYFQRPTKDIDLLVDAGSRHEARCMLRAFTKHGYTVSEYDWSRHHAASLQSPQGIFVDILFVDTEYERTMVGRATTRDAFGVVINAASPFDMFSLKVGSARNKDLLDAADLIDAIVGLPDDQIGACTLNDSASSRVAGLSRCRTNRSKLDRTRLSPGDYSAPLKHHGLDWTRQSALTEPGRVQLATALKSVIATPSEGSKLPRNLRSNLLSFQVVLKCLSSSLSTPISNALDRTRAFCQSELDRAVLASVAAGQIAAITGAALFLEAAALGQTAKVEEVSNQGASGFVGGNWSGLGVIGMARHAGIGV
jgi:hypothetical protein